MATRARARVAAEPAKARLVEVIGARTHRTKVKRRKAWRVGESALGDETRSPPVTRRVVATVRARNQAILPGAFCRVPRKRKVVQRKKESR